MRVKSVQTRVRKCREPSHLLRNPQAITETILTYLRGIHPVDVKSQYLKESVLSKYVDLSTSSPEERRNNAIFKWLCIEKNNFSTNERLLSDDLIPSDIRKRLEFARNVIGDMLGETVPLEALYGSFSGGASTSRSRHVSHPAYKYCGKADITETALPWFELALTEAETFRELSDYEISVVRGNILFTVPKSPTIDRCAAKEPDLNMFLQRGAGDYIRTRLRKYGINLNDQSRNQRLARTGSIDGSLFTMDLSSASDSISIELVQYLLPICWFSFLNDIRSQSTFVDGDWHHNEMFSSMGNGFTFELESLIFYALTRACCYYSNSQGPVGVYGDDIIAPTPAYHDLETLLEFCGFETNMDKSFFEGPFRESCGGHYYNGVDITPFFLKGPLVTYYDLFLLGNKIRKWSQSSLFLDDLLLPLWEYISSLVDKRNKGLTDIDSNRALFCTSNGLSSFYELRPEARKRRFDKGSYLLWLNCTPSESVSSIPLTKGIVHRFRLTAVRADARLGLCQDWLRDESS